RLHARRSRALGERSGSRGGPHARLGDQPRAHPRRQSPFVPLGDGAAPAEAAPRRIRGGDARPGDVHRDRERAAGDERGGGAGGEGGLVKSALALALALCPVFVHGQGEYPRVRQGLALQFPRDHGSHPQFRSEWWYITGWLTAEVAARDFRYSLRFEAKQAALLQGERGFSRKGPDPAQASYYYSLPHLAVTGSVAVGGRKLEVSGEAWLDHEWSSEALAEDAVG